jgi:hypothetical protein
MVSGGGIDVQRDDYALVSGEYAARGEPARSVAVHLVSTVFSIFILISCLPEASSYGAARLALPFEFARCC